MKYIHCGGQGHLVGRCYQLISFPNKGSGSKSFSSKIKSNFEGSFSNVASNFVACDGSMANSFEPLSLTSEMYKKLMKLLNSRKYGKCIC